MVKRLLLLVLVIAAGAGACTLFDAAPPGNSCKSDNDCFRAQGEVCNQTTHTCIQRPVADAGIDAPPLADAPDASMADAPDDAPADAEVDAL